METQATAPFSCCPRTASLLFGHIARMLDETDAKIVIASPWRTGDHQDALVICGRRLSNNISLLEAIDMAQNRRLWRLMFIWHYTLLVVHARNEDDDIHSHTLCLPNHFVCVL